MKLLTWSGTFPNTLLLFFSFCESTKAVPSAIRHAACLHRPKNGVVFFSTVYHNERLFSGAHSPESRDQRHSSALLHLVSQHRADSAGRGAARPLRVQNVRLRSGAGEHPQVVIPVRDSHTIRNSQNVFAVFGSACKCLHVARRFVTNCLRFL